VRLEVSYARMDHEYVTDGRTDRMAFSNSVMHCNIVRDVLKTAIRHNAGI